jgi:hypothetical protein
MDNTLNVATDSPSVAAEPLVNEICGRGVDGTSESQLGMKATALLVPDLRCCVTGESVNLDSREPRG